MYHGTIRTIYVYRCSNQCIISGTVISIGFVVDEGVPDRFIYSNKKPYSKARTPLVAAWLLLGYLITMSYKSVLLASLVSIQYEKPIETLEDMLVTDKKILVMPNTSIESAREI